MRQCRPRIESVTYDAAVTHVRTEGLNLSAFFTEATKEKLARFREGKIAAQAESHAQESADLYRRHIDEDEDLGVL